MVREVYVFLICRPCDKGDAWATVYDDRELAEAAPHRVSEIAVVTFEVAP